MPNVNDLKRSKFLTQGDVDPPILVTIIGYEEVDVAREGADPEMRWALYFKEVDKPLILNSTNGQIIASITGSENFDDWKGTAIVLYRDRNISFGGKLVGGIRIRAPKASYMQQQPQEAEPEVEDEDIPF